MSAFPEIELLSQVTDKTKELLVWNTKDNESRFITYIIWNEAAFVALQKSHPDLRLFSYM